MPETKQVYSELIEEWEKQQNSHIAFREDRFSVMFDLAEQFFPGKKRLLDIACGPGSLSRRFLERFPGANSTAVDYDPVLLHIGREVLSGFQKRLLFVERDLRENKWYQGGVNGPFDLAMSTTALHWLDEGQLKNLYKSTYKLLGNGGVFMNGDHMVSESRNENISNAMHKATSEWSKREFVKSGALDWDQWWNRVKSMESFRDLLKERGKRYKTPDNHNNMVSLERHWKFLKSAGFSEIDVVWQYSNDRILVARK